MRAALGVALWSLILRQSAALSYDFIVVGGGSSGSVLAAVLATKGPTLLLERGANHSLYPQSQVPEGWPQISAIAWTEVQATDSKQWTGTANVLGGGSTVNGAGCWRSEVQQLSDVIQQIQQLSDMIQQLSDVIQQLSDMTQSESECE